MAIEEYNIILVMLALTLNERTVLKRHNLGN